MGDETTDDETKKYIDSKTIRLGLEIQNTFNKVKQDMENVQKRLKKLEEKT